MTRTLAALALGAAALASAGPASAATVSMPFDSHAGGYRVGPQDYYRLTLVTAAGEANRITIEGSSPRQIRVTDGGAPLSAGENCRPDGDGVLCSVSGTVDVFLIPPEFDLGDGNDELTVTGIAATVNGGPGDDRISFPNHRLTVDGGPGADFMRARDGGVTYADRTVGVSVSPDGVANDGEPGEGDDVGPTFDRIEGGSGDDELHAIDAPEFRTWIYGSSGNDRLFGGPGADELIGAGGDDSLLGAAGRDELDGGLGGDLLRGGDDHDLVLFKSAYGVDVTLDDRPGDGAPGENDDAGSDIESVSGTPQHDRIVGSDGPNVIQTLAGGDYVDAAGGADSVYGGGPGSRIIGGAGPDYFQAVGDRGTFEARDGERDEIFCGGGHNTYSTDPFDTFVNCTPSVLKPLESTFRARRSGSVRVPIRCTYGSVTDAPCTGRLYIYRRGEAGTGSPIGRARFALPPQDLGIYPHDVLLTKVARKELIAKRRLRVVAVWRTRNESPRTSATGQFDLKLLAPARR